MSSRSEMKKEYDVEKDVNLASLTIVLASMLIIQTGCENIRKNNEKRLTCRANWLIMRLHRKDEYLLQRYCRFYPGWCGVNTEERKVDKAAETVSDAVSGGRRWSKR